MTNPACDIFLIAALVRATSARHARAKPNGIGWAKPALFPVEYVGIMFTRQPELCFKIAALRCNRGSLPFTCSLLPGTVYRLWN